MSIIRRIALVLALLLVFWSKYRPSPGPTWI